MFFAHTSDKAPWQPLSEHLLRTGELAACFAAKFGAAPAGRLMGSLHDLGKYTDKFQNRLKGATVRVDHATAGARIISELVSGGMDRGMAELMAYGIAGHHGGLPDKTGGDRSLTARIRDDDTRPDPVWRSEVAIEPTELLPSSFKLNPNAKRRPFQFATLGRMLFSCLVDADFRDTEAYYAAVEGQQVERDWPALPTTVDGLITKFDAHMARVTAASAGDPTLNKLRGKVLAHVRGLAGKPTGLFTLTVPTGGGKTLASLAFALEHAKANKLDRIVYAIPFTSIIDQTAAIFRDVLGKELVLEHHSAIDLKSAREEEEFRDKDSEAKLRLAMEDWAAPVVVTTNVQLFESLFANRPSRCRKLHNLARSVIVLDEAQTIPRHVLLPCIAALDELAHNYGASVVLCTATQPALRKEDGFEDGFADVRELAPEPLALHEALKRVTLRQAGEMREDDLVKALAGTDRVSSSSTPASTRSHCIRRRR